MRKIFPTILVAMMFLTAAVPVLAYKIEDLGDIRIEGDFVIGPAKKEIWLNPGDNTSVDLIVTNRLGEEMGFRIGIEDFIGSRDPGEVALFLGETKGPYSLKDYMKPEITEFTLRHGERMALPVQIAIPMDAEPGGRYGAVMISTFTPSTETGPITGAQGGVQFVSRLASLFLVRVRGDLNEEGYLKDVNTLQSVYQQGPISFNVLYENNGNVHLIPYGVLEIKNMLGRKVDEIEITPYFAMPDSLRLKELVWDKTFLFGKYTALVSLNRGYQDIVDESSVTFWVLPWKIIAIGMAGLFVAIIFFKWVFSHFEVKKKPPTTTTPKSSP